MKTFLDAWLAEAPNVLTEALGATVGLQLAAQSSLVGSPATLAVIIRGPLSGRFLVAADPERLQLFLRSARASASEPDEDGNLELWRSALKKTVAKAANVVSSGPADGLSVAIEGAEWDPSLPMAIRNLAIGEAVLPLALIDQVEVEAASRTPSSAQAADITEPEQFAPQESAAAREAAGIPRRGDAARSSGIASGGVELLLGVELEASLRFGSREMPLNEVLNLGAGDVVELDRNVNDPVDLLVGDKIVARGEVVLIDGSFGLRVLEVSEPQKRLESIRCLF